MGIGPGKFPVGMAQLLNLYPAQLYDLAAQTPKPNPMESDQKGTPQDHCPRTITGRRKEFGGAEQSAQRLTLSPRGASRVPRSSVSVKEGKKKTKSDVSHTRQPRNLSGRAILPLLAAQTPQHRPRSRAPGTLTRPAPARRPARACSGW